MIIAVQFAAIAKKILELFLSNSKGRKFLGYVIGIAIFIVLLPVIMIYGLFGWMAGDSDNMLDKNVIISQLPAEEREQLLSMNDICNNIEIIFVESGLTDKDVKKAQSIYVSKLVGLESEVNFYLNLANCFLLVSDEKSVYQLIEESFLVAFTEEEKTDLDEFYGVTSAPETDE